MTADAMAQFLAARGWREVLLLAGPDPASLADAGAFAAAAEKFGVEIVETRPFELTNDPRRRELSNLALLTGGVDYDVVYVADAVGEFARFVPYATYAPRPVVGSAGLRALAWHWSLERSGAPQLNQRFARRSDARMSPQDWAAWAAVRTVVEAITQTGGTDMPELRAFIESDDFALDLYKGLPGSYRPWDGQLRQQVVTRRQRRHHRRRATAAVPARDERARHARHRPLPDSLRQQIEFGLRSIENGDFPIALWQHGTEMTQPRR